ncbi:MAG: hypothetical protein PUB69_05990 [Desulfovibrionaceae bacterium]|nr:hypothetical protein [Desulfovibrionaceae bacterium]
MNAFRSLLSAFLMGTAICVGFFLLTTVGFFFLLAFLALFGVLSLWLFFKGGKISKHSQVVIFSGGEFFQNPESRQKPDEQHQGVIDIASDDYSASNSTDQKTNRKSLTL